MSVRSHSHAVFTLLLCIPAQRTRSNGVFAQHLRPSEGWIASAPGEVHRGVGKTARRDPWWKPSLSYLVPWTGTSRSSLASDHLNWLAGTSVVLNSPSFEPSVALSIFGIERSPDNGYFPAKVAQEDIIKKAGIPHTIVRSTQFMEFLVGIADSATANGKVHVSHGAFQPIAADDVADFVAEAVCGKAENRTIEIAGPEKGPMSDFIKGYLTAIGDARTVIVDPQARYFGSLVDDESLVPLESAEVGKPDVKTWFARGLQATA